MNENYKEVYYNEYCPRCKHFKNSMTDDPCNDCLTESVNLYTHRPVKFEEGDS